MKIYMHCLTNQDLTKQFAYTNEIRKEFFDDAKDQDEISVEGIKSGREQKVRVLTATDCRLNANFQYILSQEGSATIGDIVIFYKIGFKKYKLELIEKTNSKYQIYKDLFSDRRHLPIYTNSEQVYNNEIIDNKTTSSITPAIHHEQIIFYGVPGSGKSFKIDNEKTKDAAEFQKQKVVFHPDYTNSDFVGQIIPKMREIEDCGEKKSVIEYSFKPGPFTTILRRALRNKGQKFYLIIEEINRGNAAAIFGELFQLLDRDEKGWSCSPVNNDDINYYVASEHEFWEEEYKDNHEYNAKCVNHPDGTEEFCRNSGLRLPPNLSIYATMNTNDQNVFTLDNAFNRRFKSSYISNKEDSSNQAHCDQYNLEIGETKVLWGAFRKQINQKIVESGFTNAEDKQLGLFFIKKEKDANKIDEKDFADKVLKYLWHDVFKRDCDIFNGTSEIRKFEDLIDNFKGEDALRNCFDNNFVESINKDNAPLVKADKENSDEQ